MLTRKKMTKKKKFLKPKKEYSYVDHTSDRIIKAMTLSLIWRAEMK